MEAWTDFFLGELGASAALTGLIFVSVSIKLSRILSIQNLPKRALLAVLMLLLVLILSSLMLVPGQPSLAVGIEVAAPSCVAWFSFLILDLRIFRETKPEYRRVYLRHLALNQIAMIFCVGAGTVLILGRWEGLYILVPGLILLILKALLDAWILLIEINR